MKTPALALLVWSLAFGAASAAPRGPVVVELYTAQGCSACLKADAHLAQLAERKDVLPLTFSVDYWDYLGWPDTFARPAHAERQRAYARSLSLREVYTPQVIVDGRAQATGSKVQQVDRLIAQSRKLVLNPPDMAFVGEDRAAVGSGPAPRGGGEIWLIRYDPRPQETVIRKGDNKGETLVQHNVVREVVRLGDWKGRPVVYRMPAAREDGLRTVILLQAAHGGRVLGVMSVLPDPPAALTPEASDPRPRPMPGR